MMIRLPQRMYLLFKRVMWRWVKSAHFESGWACVRIDRQEPSE